MVRHLLLATLFCGFNCSLIAQQEIKQLSVGDEMPDVFLEHFFNDTSKRIQFSSLKGKLVILDFWNTSCLSCIKAMPKMDSLQKEFKDKIKIILVTKNTTSEVARLFSKIKIAKPDLPIIVSDQFLYKYFPHTTVPHHVWIDSNGIVKFITDGYNTTAENVGSFLNGNSISLHLKDESTNFDEYQPFLSEDNGRLIKNILNYSVITNRIDEYGGNTAFVMHDTLNQQTGLKIINATILSMYKIAFGKSINENKWFNNRVILEVMNKGNFFYPLDNSRKDEWKSKNLYGYESRITNDKKGELFSHMIQDLNRFFPYVGKLEKRKVKCYILQRTGTEDKLKTKYQNSKPFDDGNVLHNVSFSLFMDRLYAISNSFTLPLVNEVLYNGNVDFEINTKPNEIITVNDLRIALKNYGLKLCEGEREIEMLVIKDK
jgi:thiol-disulfide isomerase/thioredoxin